MPMLMTTRYYDKKSKRTVLFCSAIAAIVGTLQSIFIVMAIKK
jgi:hypothetical protein